MSGAVLGLLLSVIGAVTLHDRDFDRNPCIMCFVALVMTIGGPFLGYLAGGLIAGVLLLLNKLQPPLEDVEDDDTVSG